MKLATLGHNVKKLYSGVIRDIRQFWEATDKPIFTLYLSTYLIVAYLANKAAWLYRLIPEYDFVDRILKTFEWYNMAFVNPLPSLNPDDLSAGFILASILAFAFYLKKKNARKMRPGIEYGSARWGNKRDIAPLIDPEFKNNIILTSTERLMCSFPTNSKISSKPFAKPGNPKYNRNKNVLVIGSSGSGKTRFYVKPNLMQMHSSYVVTDPKGTLLPETGEMLRKNGYRIKVVNTINFRKSMRYNPFSYIHSEKDILKLVNALIANTKGEGEHAGEDFWVKAERLLYCAYIGYIWYEVPEEEQNFETLIDMIDASETREEDESFKNAIDYLFDELEVRDPDHFALRQYKKYKLAAGKTAKSILISCGARLAPFDIKELRDFTRTDELDLDMIGEEKTALFIIISDTDSTFNFIVAIMYTQLFNLLCEKADDVYHGKLPIHVRCILDEFSNVGKIPQFEKLIATIRSREISASIILQSKSQLKALYKDNAETIEGNCDTMLFLGGNEKTTLKDLEEMLGKETIDLYNTSDTRGTSRSKGLNYQKTGKSLMTRDEIAVMDGGKCILQVRGVRPFLSSKYDITSHPAYLELADFDSRNYFNIEKYIKNMNHAVMKPSDIISEVYDAGFVE